MSKEIYEETIQIKGLHGESNSEHLTIKIHETNSFQLDKYIVHAPNNIHKESITLPLTLWRRITSALDFKNKKIMDDIISSIEKEMKNFYQ